MVPKIIQKATKTAFIPLKVAVTSEKEARLPNVFRKAGIDSSWQRCNETLWFMHWGPDCGKPLKRDLQWRDSLAGEVLPLIDSADEKEVSEKAVALRKGCKGANRSLKRLGTVARLEKWAGGAIATVAFLCNPMSCARMLGKIIVSESDIIGKAGDSASLLLMALGTVVFGFAAWSISKIKSARAGFAYLSGSASFLAGKVLPADEQARRIECETSDLYYGLSKHLESEGSAMMLLTCHSIAADKIQGMGLGAITARLAKEQAEIADSYRLEAEAYLNKVGARLDELEREASSFNAPASEDGRTWMSIAGKNIEKTRNGLEQAEFACSVCAGMIDTIRGSPLQKSVPEPDAGMVAAIESAADLLVKNSLAGPGLLKSKEQNANRLVVAGLGSPKKVAVTQSEEFIKWAVNMIKANARLGASGMPAMQYLVHSLLDCSKLFAKAVQSGELHDLGVAVAAERRHMDEYFEMAANFAQSN